MTQLTSLLKNHFLSMGKKVWCIKNCTQQVKNNFVAAKSYIRQIKNCHFNLKSKKDKAKV